MDDSAADELADEPSSVAGSPRFWEGELAYEPVYLDQLKAGDKIRALAGTRNGDRYGRARLEFVKHGVNMRTGREWLVCWGGKASHAGWVYLSVDGFE